MSLQRLLGEPQGPWQRRPRLREDAFSWEKLRTRAQIRRKFKLFSNCLECSPKFQEAVSPLGCCWISLCLQTCRTSSKIISNHGKHFHCWYMRWRSYMETSAYGCEVALVIQLFKEPKVIEAARPPEASTIILCVHEMKLIMDVQGWQENYCITHSLDLLRLNLLYKDRESELFRTFKSRYTVMDLSAA